MSPRLVILTTLFYSSLAQVGSAHSGIGLPESEPANVADEIAQPNPKCKENLFAGLPLHIRVNEPELQHATPFEAEEAELPISDDDYQVTRVSTGKEIPDDEMFRDELYALIPKGTKIESYTLANGKKKWIYPVGTTLFHRIYFRSRPEKLFEMRMERRLANGHFAMGVFREDPASPEGRLKLDTNCENAPNEKIITKLSSGLAQLSYKRIGIESCNGCHNTGHSDVPGKMGPYEFIASNPKLQAWRKEYASEHGGEDPIVERTGLPPRQR
jgi:hypothetical protein